MPFIFIIQFIFSFINYFCMIACPYLLFMQKYSVCILKKLEDICEVLVILKIYYRR